ARHFRAAGALAANAAGRGVAAAVGWGIGIEHRASVLVHHACFGRRRISLVLALDRLGAGGLVENVRPPVAARSHVRRARISLVARHWLYADSRGRVDV